MRNLYGSLKVPVLVGVVTGVLYSTSYPPFRAWALFFAFAPLWVYWFQAKTFKQVLVSAFTAQFVLTLIGFNWIAHTSIEYGHIPAIWSVLILIGFCCFASLNVVLAGAVAWWIQKRRPLNNVWYFIFVAVLSGACDWLYPMIFPWNTGYPLLFSKFHSAQLAEWVGFSLLAVPVYLANAAFAISFVRYPRKNWSRPLIIFVVALFICEITGQWLEKRLPEEDKKLSALLVQPNIGNYDKYVAERGYGYQGPVVQKDLTVTEKGLASAGSNPPDLIIWPETAYPENLDPWFKDRFYVRELQTYINLKSIPLITGAYSEDGPTVKNKRDYNAMFALVPKAPLSEGYRKQLLLAFGEYFPGAQFFPFLKNIVPEISDFGRGRGPMVMEVAGARFLPLICYEGLDAPFVQKAVNLGGQIFVNVTNDSWFGNNFEPWQHMIMTVARTVVFRRPMVRVTNTGMSVVADLRGKILTQGPQNVEWAGVAQIPYLSSPPQTFFSFITPWLSVIFIALVLLAFYLGRFFSDQKRT